MVNKKIKKLIGGIAVLSLTAIISASAFGAGIVQDFPGSYNFGPGTKSSGWVVKDSAETETTGGNIGTLTTFAVPGSSTVFVVADVIGRAGTGTARLSNIATGTFDRVGTAAMTNVGTETLGSDSSTALESAWVIQWKAGDGASNAVQLEVKGTNTKIQWIGHVRAVTITTTGVE